METRSLYSVGLPGSAVLPICMGYCTPAVHVQYGVLDLVRTGDLRFRKALLYPAELRGLYLSRCLFPCPDVSTISVRRPCSTLFKLFAEESWYRIAWTEIVIAQDGGLAHTSVEVPALAARRDPLLHHATHGVLERGDSVVYICRQVLEPLMVVSHCVSM